MQHHRTVLIQNKLFKSQSVYMLRLYASISMRYLNWYMSIRTSGVYISIYIVFYFYTKLISWYLLYWSTWKKGYQLYVKNDRMFVWFTYKCIVYFIFHNTRMWNNYTISRYKHNDKHLSVVKKLFQWNKSRHYTVLISSNNFTVN